MSVERVEHHPAWCDVEICDAYNAAGDPTGDHREHRRKIRIECFRGVVGTGFVTSAAPEDTGWTYMVEIDVDTREEEAFPSVTFQMEVGEALTLARNIREAAKAAIGWGDAVPCPIRVAREVKP